MNILIVTDCYPPDKLSGVAEIAKNLKKAYEDFGHTVYILTIGMPRDTDGSQGIFRSSGNLAVGVLLNNFWAAHYIKKYKIDLVHLHQPMSTLFLILRILRSAFGFPFVISSPQVTYFSEFSEVRPVTIEGVRFLPTFQEYVQKYLFAPVHIVCDLAAYLFADVITAPSAEMKKEIQRTYGKIIKKEIKVIPNGVDSAAFAFDTKDCDLPIVEQTKNNRVLAYVGAFRMRKRVFNLLFALKKVLEHIGNVKLLLIGGGRGYETILRELARKLKIEKNVIFIGKIQNSEIPCYLDLADIICLPSSYEGFPVALLEAMSMGKAVLASRVSGMLDLIEDSVTGKFFKVDDVDELAKVIIELLSDAGLLEKIGRNAQAVIQQKYQWDRIAHQYIELLG